MRNFEYLVSGKSALFHLVHEIQISQLFAVFVTKFITDMKHVNLCLCSLVVDLTRNRNVTTQKQTALNGRNNHSRPMKAILTSF